MQRFRIFLRRTYGGLPGVTWLICAAAFVNRAGAMVLPFLSLYLGRRFGYTVEQAGYVVALFGLGSMLGSVLGGRLTDRVGPVRLQIATLSLTAAWMWALMLVGSPALLAAGVFVLGALNDAFRPGNVAAVAASVPRFRQSKALTLNRLALNAGWAIGPALGGMLAQYDYRLLFFVDGLTCGLAALVLWCLVPRAIGRRAPGPVAVDALPRPSPWTDRRFLVLLLCSVLCFMTFLQHFQTLSRHLNRVLAFDEAAIGRLLMINPTLIVLCEMPFVHALRGRAQLPIVAAGSLTIGVAYPWLVAQSWGTAAVVASCLTITLGEMLYMPFLGAHVSEHAPAAVRGDYLGAYFATFSLGFIVAPALGGWVYDTLGADALWWSCLGCGVVAGLGLLGLHRTDPARALRARP